MEATGELWTKGLQLSVLSASGANITCCGYHCRYRCHGAQSLLEVTVLACCGVRQDKNWQERVHYLISFCCWTACPIGNLMCFEENNLVVRELLLSPLQHCRIQGINGVRWQRSEFIIIANGSAGCFPTLECKSSALCWSNTHRKQDAKCGLPVWPSQ